MEKKLLFLNLFRRASLLTALCLFSFGQGRAEEVSVDKLFEDYLALNGKATLLLAVGQQNPLDIRVTFSVKGVSLANFVTVLQKSVGDKVFFNIALDEELKKTGDISVDANDMTINDLLKKVLPLKGLTYSVKGNVVIIFKQQKIEADKMNVNGIVLDADTKKPIPGATIIVLGTTTGAISDEKGQFNFSMQPGLDIEISYIGMKPITKRIAIGDEAIVVELQKDAMAVEDVVVTGYFNKSSNLFTGAVKTIKKEEIQKFGNAGVLNILAMSDPSFKIREDINAGSDPNKVPDFFVRGESSFMGGSNLPTFIVDGYEVTVRYVLDMDIDRIESLSILKDASATVFYGSRAANGVVVIETRRPSQGKLLVSYSNRTSLSAADLSDYNLMNAREKLDYEIYAGLFDAGAGENSGSAQLSKDKMYQAIYQNVNSGVNTDWISKPIRNAFSHNHSLNVSGGNEVVTYAINGSYGKNVGVIKESSRENYSLGFDLSYRIKNKVNIKNSFTFSNSRENNSPYGSFSDYALSNPYEKIFDERGNYIERYDRHGSITDERHYNKLYNASLNHKDFTSTASFINNFSVDYNITTGLRFIASLAVNKSMGDNEYFLSPMHSSFLPVEKDMDKPVDVTKRGIYTIGSNKGFSYNINSTLSYNKIFGKHNLYTGIGINLNDDRIDEYSFSARGFSDEDFDHIAFALGYNDDKLPNGRGSQSRLVGFLANINYSYENRYFVDFSGRLDGSSKYGADKRFAPLWSVGVGWNLNNERFLKDVTTVETLKLRASIGATGNQNFNTSQSRLTYKYYMDDIYYQSIGASYIQYGNKNLEWQQTLKRNIGIDVILFSRRLSVTANYYNDKTNGLLLPITVAPSLGFNTYTENFGEQKNYGFEFDINGSIVRNKNLDISVFVSGNHNVNKIMKISNALASLNEKENSNSANFKKPVAMYEEGESVNALKAVRSLGINPQSGNEVFLSRDGKPTEIWDYRDKVNVGNTSSDLEGTIGINVMYKNISVNASLMYAFGGVAYNHTIAERVEGADPMYNADKRVLEERWIKPGDVTFYKNIKDRTVSNLTSRFVQKNNYLDMGNISVSYRFSKDPIKKLGLTNLRLALNTNNVFHISTIKRERGLDYPFARQFTFSLNANF